MSDEILRRLAREAFGTNVDINAALRFFRQLTRLGDLEAGDDHTRNDAAARKELRRRALNGDINAIERLEEAWSSGHNIREVVIPDDAQDLERSTRAQVVPVPQGFPVPARPARQPYYDREVLDDKHHEALFFGNPRANQLGEPKTRADCNLPGNGGSIPRGHYGRYSSVLMLPDIQNDPNDLLHVWDHGRLGLYLGSTPYLEWPVRQVMIAPRKIETGEVGVIHAVMPLDHGVNLTVPDRVRVMENGHMVDKRVPGLPLELSETEAFSFLLSVPGPLRKKFYVMVVMLGVLLRPLSY